MAHANGTASSMADQMKVIFDAGREILLGKAGDAKERIVDAGATVKDKIGDAGSTVKDKLGDAKDVVTDRGSSALSMGRRMVKEHPFIAVAVAFGLGYVALRMARR